MNHNIEYAQKYGRRLMGIGTLGDPEKKLQFEPLPLRAPEYKEYFRKIEEMEAAIMEKVSLASEVTVNET